MNSLLELADRCENAAAADREIDYAIALSLGNILGADRPWGKLRHGHFPAFTGSIDAARLIIPEGMEWMVSNRAPSPAAGRAYINNRELQYVGGAFARNPKYFGSETTAATPALALCVTALHALHYRQLSTCQRRGD